MSNYQDFSKWSALNFAKNIDIQKYQPQETKKQKTVSIFQDFSKWSALNFAKKYVTG